MATATDVIDTDYVIVGAGSAGCVMAARLSEDPATRVTLLEAGGEDRNMWIHIPLGYGKTITDKRVNWCYETEPDPGVNNRKVFWPRGKVLGGSSSINGLVYTPTLRKSGKTSCQPGLRRFCFIDDPPWLPGQRIAPRPD